MLKRLLSGKISVSLKNEGFIGRGLSWNREVEDVIQVIEFQRDRYSSVGVISFTINIGVFRREVWSIAWGVPEPSFVKEEHCFPRIRVGEIMHDAPGLPKDIWWRIHKDVQDFENLENIREAIINKCIPKLNQLSDIDYIFDYYVERQRFILPADKIYLAILLQKCGRSDEANSLFGKISAVSEEWKSRVLQVQKNLG
ncbi:MAG: DUF4304 domain-containing protein [Erythrobacter sp.]